ncbi:hypothetical protein O3M35_002966 [Rhynocoris fuscipes]|uniref:Fucosyltransferase n=1 Tax=Rhynocoris fuscipes TaxID=488301 RepID=A0AAW1CIP1_9HEMI
MPRLSAKRSCLSFILVAIIFFVYLSWPEHQRSAQYHQTHKYETNNHIKVKEVGDTTEEDRATVTSSSLDHTEDLYTLVENSAGKPWFIDGGTIRPTPPSVGPNGRRKASLWPQERPGHDRIIDQLMFVPRDEAEGLKVVVMYNGLSSWGPTVKAGRGIFKGCPVDTCILSGNRHDSKRADAIIYKDQFTAPMHRRNTKQVWIVFMLECPYHTQHYKYNDVFNWTATYRTDSDIVTPYEKWVYYNERIKQLKTPIKNFAANKTKQVAWFVSNCGARNGRLQYARALQKYINVDIFGACGSKKCPRSNQSKCFDMLGKDYKFYLAFENSNCREYITEKFFVNGLGNDVLPIVMGARPEDYELVAPMKSYIHVDEFESPKQLAEYLHKLDADDNLYNEYFRWKGTGEFINTHFFCRVCALLHDQYPIKSYRDINEWWRSVGTCTSGSWRRPKENQQPAWGNQFG